MNSDLMEKVYNMQMGDTMNISKLTEVQRIPGGYLYVSQADANTNPSIASAFIPFGVVLHDKITLREQLYETKQD